MIPTAELNKSVAQPLALTETSPVFPKAKSRQDLDELPRSQEGTHFQSRMIDILCPGFPADTTRRGSNHDRLWVLSHSKKLQNTMKSPVASSTSGRALESPMRGPEIQGSRQHGLEIRPLAIRCRAAGRKIQVGPCLTHDGLGLLHILAVLAELVRQAIGGVEVGVSHGVLG